jgi:hypothetical protein
MTPQEVLKFIREQPAGAVCLDYEKSMVILASDLWGGPWPAELPSKVFYAGHVVHLTTKPYPVGRVGHEGEFDWYPANDDEPANQG